MTRWGMAVAMMLAFAPMARACDTRGYDAEADQPREGSCPTAVADDGRYSAVDYDFRLATAPGKGAGSGSGEPEAGDARAEPSDAAFLQMVWTAP
jgi:hypothetical protein